MKEQTENLEAVRSNVIVEGLVISDPFGGSHEDRVAIHVAERWADMAQSAATVLAVARGDTGENIFQSQDGRTWSIRRG